MVRDARSLLKGLLVGLGILGTQVPPAGAQAPEALGVGESAPEFALTGATRYGVLKNPVRLSDFKGQTVVLAFFYKARTRG